MRVALVGLLLGLGASQAAAQSRVAVLSEPGTPVVATEILLAVGPADEEDDLAGLAFLAARTVVAPILPVLDSLGAHLTVTPQKDALSFSIVSAPDAWQESTELLAEVLFNDPPSTSAMEREREAIVRELEGRTANPADAATRAMDRAFFGSSHPWGRPTIGTPESVRRINFADLGEFLRNNFTPGRAFAATSGPVEPASATAHLQPLLGTRSAAPVELIPFRPAERPVRIEYNSITTWVGASFRFPETADEDVMRFIAFLAARELAPSPAQRSVYNVESEVVTRVGGGEIRLQVVVPPEEAEDWEERMTDVIADLLATPLPEDVYAGLLRRFRGERLMELASPEERAHAAARQLLIQGEVGELAPSIDGLTAQVVREAAASLGPPTVVVLGPTLEN